MILNIRGLVLLTWFFAGATVPVGPAGAQTAQAQQGLAGAYLAARAASASNDLVDAAHYLRIALDLDPDNLGLVEQLMLVTMGLGDIEAAAPLAHEVAASGRRNHVAEVVLLVEEVMRGDFDAARQPGPGRAESRNEKL